MRFPKIYWEMGSTKWNSYSVPLLTEWVGTNDCVTLTISLFGCHVFSNCEGVASCKLIWTYLVFHMSVKWLLWQLISSDSFVTTQNHIALLTKAKWWQDNSQVFFVLFLVSNATGFPQKLSPHTAIVKIVFFCIIYISLLIIHLPPGCFQFWL